MGLIVVILLILLVLAYPVGVFVGRREAERRMIDRADLGMALEAAAGEGGACPAIVAVFDRDGLGWGVVGDLPGIVKPDWHRPFTVADLMPIGDRADVCEAIADLRSSEALAAGGILSAGHHWGASIHPETGKVTVVIGPRGPLKSADPAFSHAGRRRKKLTGIG